MGEWLVETMVLIAEMTETFFTRAAIVQTPEAAERMRRIGEMSMREFGMWGRMDGGIEFYPPERWRTGPL